MASWVKYVVLDVGQGTANFVEIYDPATGALGGTMLIDFGSEKEKEKAGGPSVEYIVAKLKLQAQPTLDALFLSHSDSDHISLLPDLLNAFNPYQQGAPPDKSTLWVRNVAHASPFAHYKKGSYNVLVDVTRYMGGGAPSAAPVGFTSFDNGALSAPLFTLGGVRVYVWVANAAMSRARSKGKSTEPTSAYDKNTNSMVLVLDCNGTRFVATGDATGVTLVAANNVATPAIVQAFLKNTFMVTAPHHGSASTTFNLEGLSTDRSLAEDNLARFAVSMNADVITASAERKSTFRHPSAEVLSFFWEGPLPGPLWSDPMLAPSNRHFYTAYFLQDGGWDVASGDDSEPWPDQNAWYSIQTSENVYTNLYFVPAFQSGVDIPPQFGSKVPLLTWPSGGAPPPLGVSWSFEVDSTGTKSLVRLDNRPTTLALRRALRAGVRPEDLPTVEHAELEAMRVPSAPAAPAPAPPPAPPGNVVRPAPPALPRSLRRTRIVP